MKLRSIAICTVALAALAAYAQGSGSSVSGHPRIVDGDTIAFGLQRVRIFGIDAPESDQTCPSETGPWYCGEVATMALVEEIGSKPVRCDQKDTDIYGRVVAICYVDGHDIGAAMVRHGWAVDFTRYSHGLYSKEEDEARYGKRGIWKGRFQRPEYWRREHRERRR